MAESEVGIVLSTSMCFTLRAPLADQIVPNNLSNPAGATNKSTNSQINIPQKSPRKAGSFVEYGGE